MRNVTMTEADILHDIKVRIQMHTYPANRDVPVFRYRSWIKQ
jgi:hypothetical protein